MIGYKGHFKLLRTYLPLADAVNVLGWSTVWLVLVHPDDLPAGAIPELDQVGLLLPVTAFYTIRWITVGESAPIESWKGNYDGPNVRRIAWS